MSHYVYGRESQSRPLPPRLKGFFLLDTNALGILLRNPKALFHLRERLHNVSGKDVLEPIVVGSSLFEALGMVLPAADIQPSDHLVEAMLSEYQKYRRGEQDNSIGRAIGEVRSELYIKHRDWLLAHPDFSYARAVDRYEETLGRCRPDTAFFFEECFRECLVTPEAYHFFVQRVVTEYAFGFELESFRRGDAEFENLLHAACLLDLALCHQGQLNFTLARPLSRSWLTFSRQFIRNIRSGVIGIDVDLATFANNLKTARNMLAFKRTGRDLLDLELVHYACLGKNRNDAIFPVVCITADPPEKIRYRLAFYRSIVAEAFEYVGGTKQRENLKLEPKEGWVILLGENGKPVYEFDVKKIPSLTKKIGSIALSNDWYP